MKEPATNIAHELLMNPKNPQIRLKPEHRLNTTQEQNASAMNNIKNKIRTREELIQVLNRIYESLKYTPVRRKRMKPIPIESDWNWHYNY